MLPVSLQFLSTGNYKEAGPSRGGPPCQEDTTSQGEKPRSDPARRRPMPNYPEAQVNVRRPCLYRSPVLGCV